MRIHSLGALLLCSSLAAVVVTAQDAAPAAIDGHWEGAITIMGRDLAIRVDVSSGPNGLAATIDIPQQGASGLALRSVSYRPPHAHFELPAGPGLATFEGTAAGATISGTFTQGGATGTFRLDRSVQAQAAPAATPEPPPYREEDVTYSTAAGTFAGTLTLPPSPGRHPAVVLITGSGPQNRDEELFGFKPFRVIADHLTRHGVAVLRCDDRSVGATTAKADGATTADLAGDALAAVKFLAGRPEVDPTRIGLLGHSEGGVIAPMAAAQSPDVAFIVMLSGMGVTGERILIDQAAAIGRAAGSSPADLVAEERLQRHLFRAARTGQGWDEVQAEAKALVVAKIEALPEPQRSAIGDPGAYADRAIAGQLAMSKSAWFKAFIDLDPASWLARVHCPVLALFGEKDLQVPAESNRAAVAAALARAGNTDVTVRVVPGANHLYQKAVTGSPAEYATLEKAFVPGLLDSISDWIGAHSQPRGQTGASARPDFPSSS